MAYDFNEILRRAMASGLGSDPSGRNSLDSIVNSIIDPQSGLQVYGTGAGYGFAKPSDDPSRGQTMNWLMDQSGQMASDQPNYYSTGSMGSLLGEGLKQLSPVILAAIGGGLASGSFGDVGSLFGGSTGGADAATSAAWQNGAGLGGDTLSAMGLNTDAALNLGGAGAGSGGMAGGGGTSGGMFDGASMSSLGDGAAFPPTDGLTVNFGSAAGLSPFAGISGAGGDLASVLGTGASTVGSGLSAVKDFLKENSWALPLAGGLLGASQSGQQQGGTVSRTADPRLMDAVYGSNGNPGLLTTAIGQYKDNTARLNNPSVWSGLIDQYNVGSNMLKKWGG